MLSASSPEDEPITGINVTPLVDVVLVLLMLTMITASYLVSQAIPLELPKAATAESTPPKVLALTLDAKGRVYLDGELYDDEAALCARLRRAGAQSEALIAADGAVEHRRVVHLIDLLRREGVTHFALNVDPEVLREAH